MARRLGAPAYVAVTFAAVTAITLALLNHRANERAEMLAPGVEHVERLAVWVLLLTVPLVGLAVAYAWRGLPAPRIVKRRHLGRSVAIQAAVVGAGMALVAALQPAQARLLASETNAGGRVGYAYAWEWGCGYLLGVSDGPYFVRELSAVGPFACDAPAPHLEWRGANLVLFGADGHEVGRWPADP